MLAFRLDRAARTVQDEAVVHFYVRGTVKLAHDSFIIDVVAVSAESQSECKIKFGNKFSL